MKIFVFALLVVACSPKRSYGVKSFFFDGVPDPFVEVEKVEIDTLNTSLVDYITNIEPTSKEPLFYVHSPWQEKKCNECHSTNRRGKLNAPLNELCLNCHDNFDSNYSELHGPVASGNCAQCHDPHKSKIASLLKEEGQTLCFNCHDQQKIVGYKIHESIEDTNCTNCHNPHGGQNNFYLQPKACYECHDNFEDTYTYLHGPVATGNYCFTCHDDHNSKNKDLLKTTGKTLCLNCHEQTNIYTTTAHNEAKNQDCTNCHNPHGANQNHLLTKIIKK